MKNIIFITILLLITLTVSAEDKKNPVGIDEKLGESVTGDVTLIDENGKPVKFGDLTENKPVILVLVYFKCPGICSPLLTDLAKTIDKLDLAAGKDYKIITISFNPAEDYVMAAGKKKSYYNLLKVKKLSEGDWRFLTADSVNIAKITDAVGFRYIKQGDDFAHSGALTILSPERKISRYLYGAEFLPFDLKMALIEASEGKVGSPISKITKLCYSYDAEGRKYVLNFTRIAGSGILLLVGVFAIIMFTTKKKNKN